MSKPILCLDFDGVIHSYSSGWKGAAVIPDPPVPGALPFIVAAMEKFTVAIHSSRSADAGGITAMREWLGHWSVDLVYGMSGDFDHGIWGAIQWPTSKPSAFLTIDDRALTFTGVWPPVESLLAFKPWNKRDAQGPSDLESLIVQMEAVRGVAQRWLNWTVESRSLEGKFPNPDSNLQFPVRPTQAQMTSWVRVFDETILELRKK